jgi:GR25 family glycosyltransferase involved in LPS biosynthesis
MNKTTLILLFLFSSISVLVYFLIKHKKKKDKRDEIKENLLSLYKKTKHRFVNNVIPNNITSIDQIYCVTMPQRREYAENLFKKYNTNVTFFDAIKPVDLTKDEYMLFSETFDKNNKLMYKKMTKLPVHLSYTMCFIDALIRGYKNIIIFEDDIVINVPKDKMDKSIQEFLSSDFMMFYMGYCYPDTCDKSNFDTKTYEHLVEIYSKILACNHATVFKMEYVPDLLDFMFPMYTYTDDMYREYFKKKNFKICIPRVSYFDQNRKDFGTLNDNYQTELPTCNFN